MTTSESATSPIATLAAGSNLPATSVPGLLKIQEPFHGAVLHGGLGQKVGNGLNIRVSGEAPQRDCVSVNGQPAARAGRTFWADVILDKEINEIVAVSQGVYGRQQHEIKVVWDRLSFRRYRFSIDDNVYFLRDIFQKGYRSLFDCFYLKGLKDLHDRYGTKFVLNLFFTTGPDFNLTQFSDKYKA